jgi:hypothetical protein
VTNGGMMEKNPLGALGIVMAVLGLAVYIMNGSGPAVTFTLALAWAFSDAGYTLRGRK